MTYIIYINTEVIYINVPNSEKEHYRGRAAQHQFVQIINIIFLQNNDWRRIIIQIKPGWSFSFSVLLQCQMCEHVTSSSVSLQCCLFYSLPRQVKIVVKLQLFLYLKDDFLSRVLPTSWFLYSLESIALFECFNWATPMLSKVMK